MLSNLATANLLNLEHHTAIVTGGAKGIGRAIAERLADAKAAVMIADLDDAEARKTVACIRAGGGQAEASHADALKISDAHKVMDFTKKTFGSVDILVNNAGYYPYTPFLSVDEATWEKIININLKSIFFYSQAFAQHRIADKKPGVIINMASVEAIRSINHLSPYASAKAGVVALTKALALELAPHKIRVNAVAPGAIRTPGTAQMRKRILKEVTHHPLEHLTFAKHLHSLMESLPLKREGDPDEVARVVLILASEASSYMTGSVVVVDGGFTLV